ncbi:MAG TPA: AAA family ATPase [Fimbriimonadaceae bacterium]|nr:AAA family ATPase [Fimbriimonadaceae bacterium]
MKYFSSAQIQEALRQLRPFNPFFGVTFLVLKQANLPIGGKIRFRLDGETKRFLQDHYQVNPKSEYFFRVFRTSDHRKDWLDPNYASTGLQAINTQTFRDALLHDTHDDTWGWAPAYVNELVQKLPRGVKIPLLQLAVWLYRDRAWPENLRRTDILAAFIREFRLTDDELSSLFHTDLLSQIDERQAFQALPVKWHEIIAPYKPPPDAPLEPGGVLRFLETESLGPVSTLIFKPADRLNLITGDNGLGKTFLLDLSWWALTQNWAERTATPFELSPSKPPRIKFAVGSGASEQPVRADFNTPTGTWRTRDRLPAISGLAIYARVDGSFAVWDPANPALSRGESPSGHWPTFNFTRDDVWNGKGNQIDGLIQDWVKWQLRPDVYPAYESLQAIIGRVSPPDLPLIPGNPERIPGDRRDIPTLRHSYGQVPILFESAGIRRILTLAYLLVWAWEEHKILARQSGRPEERQIVVLIDEAEAHLHPKWQRVILPALLDVAHVLHAEMSAQWIIATHSPLVLASAEAVWDEEHDHLFHLDMTPQGKATFSHVPFELRGSIDSWLASEIFELPVPGSADRETAIRDAINLQESPSPTKAQVQQVTDRLKSLLGGEDPFWVRWVFFAESHGVRV